MSRQKRNFIIFLFIIFGMLLFLVTSSLFTAEKPSSTTQKSKSSSDLMKQPWDGLQPAPTTDSAAFTKILKVNGYSIPVLIADTPAQRTQGLSNTSALLPLHGMLFELGTEYQVPSFWMPEMRYSLDLIWIKDNTIVDITHNVPYPKNPGATLPYYRPTTAVNRVLELNAGEAKQLNLQINDTVERN